MSEVKLDLNGNVKELNDAVKSLTANDTVKAVTDARNKDQYPHRVELNEAIRLAKKVEVKSVDGDKEKPVMTFENGKLTEIAQKPPSWAKETFKEQISQLAKDSYKDAVAATKKSLGDDAKTLPPGDTSRNNGKIIAETKMHYVQQTSDDKSVAHFKSSISKPLKVGQDVSIVKAKGKVVKVADNTKELEQ